MNYDFVDRFNELEIRKGQRHGSCKVCDGDIKDKDIVYLKSFRLHSQPFHICLDCWDKINSLVNDYREENCEDAIDCDGRCLNCDYYDTEECPDRK